MKFYQLWFIFTFFCYQALAASDACILCQCANGNRITQVGNGNDPAGNWKWCGEQCAQKYGVSGVYLGPIWGNSCPTYRTFLNKTPHVVLIQFLNISAGHKNADGSFSVTAKIIIDDKGIIHGLDNVAPLMILFPNKFQRINFSHADILHILAIVQGKAACEKLGKCAGAGCNTVTACAVEGWEIASDLVNNQLNFNVVMQNNTVSLEKAASQDPHQDPQKWGAS